MRAPNPWVRCTFGSVFSCVSTARPGKHFLIETEDEDGELDDGPVSNEDNQQNEQNNGKPITLNKSAGTLR